MKVSYPCQWVRVEDYGDFVEFITDYPELDDDTLQTEDFSFFESLVIFGDNNDDFVGNGG